MPDTLLPPAGVPRPSVYLHQVTQQYPGLWQHPSGCQKS
jgi:hypothetical protein